MLLKTTNPWAKAPVANVLTQSIPRIFFINVWEPNSDYNAAVCLLNAGNSLRGFSLTCSLSTPRSYSLPPLVRILQPEKSLVFPTVRHHQDTLCPNASVNNIPDRV